MNRRQRRLAEQQQGRERRSWLQNQANSREMVKTAVAHWQSLAGATTNEVEWPMVAANRDGVPCAVTIKIQVEPLDTGESSG